LTHKSPLFYYRATLCYCGICCGRVSVCPSVSMFETGQSSAKTAKQRITQTAPHNDIGTL